MNDIKDNVDKALNEIENNQNVYATGRVVRVNKYNIEASGLNDVSFYEAVNVADKATKIFYKGQIYIIRDGKTYTIMGQEVNIPL